MRACEVGSRRGFLHGKKNPKADARGVFGFVSLFVWLCHSQCREARLEVVQYKETQRISPR